jgi:hypothetical protein
MAIYLPKLSMNVIISSSIFSALSIFSYDWIKNIYSKNKYIKYERQETKSIETKSIETKSQEPKSIDYELVPIGAYGYGSVCDNSVYVSYHNYDNTILMKNKTYDESHKCDSSSSDENEYYICNKSN